MTYDRLSRAELAILAQELLLTGTLIDRSGMGHLLSEFGLTGMTQVAIDEWMGASPVYTRRMREALNVTGETVADIFKMLQFDIGAPPQYMDFRYSLTDPYHGEFHLQSCGALVDVEPMGERMVTHMCHDIEDPTFDATAIATNPKARFRPIHRPPRVPAGRQPHCAWSVTIEPDRDELPIPQQAELIGRTNAARIQLDPIDATEEGISDYSGPLTNDVQFRQWSRSALLRIVNEFAIQQHLLSLSFGHSVRERSDDTKATEMLYKQFTGVAAVGAERIKRRLGLGNTAADLALILGLQPSLNPVRYTGVKVVAIGSNSGVRLHIPADVPAATDPGWLSTLDINKLAPIEAMAVAIDPYWGDLSATRSANGDLIIEIKRSATAVDEREEVMMTRYSTGASYQFEDRGIPLPITPVTTQDSTHGVA